MMADIKSEYTNITTDLKEIKRIIREHYEQLCINLINWTNSSKHTNY